VTSKPEIIPGEKSGWRTLSGIPFLKSLTFEGISTCGRPRDQVLTAIVSELIGSVNTRVSRDQSVRHHFPVCPALAKCCTSSSLAAIYKSHVYTVYH